MKFAVVAAGFTPGEADQLRRAMGAGAHAEIRVVVCDTVTGQCWSKSAFGTTAEEWRHLGSPEIKPKELPLKM